MNSKVSPARELAADLLDEWSKSGRFADVLLSQALDASGLDERDRSLAAELFLGVIRRRESLDCLLQAFCSRPLPSLEPSVLNIQRLAAYQIIFLSRVPTYAAVDSAVRQVKKLTSSGVHKLVNATLRSLDRSLAKDIVETNGELLKRALPLGVDKWCHFDRDIFAAPDDDPGLHLSQVYSCPDWLARRWWGRFDLQGAAAVALASVLRGPTILRPNALRTSGDELLTALTNMGLSAGRMAEGPGLWAQQIAPSQNQLFLAGHFQPQGPTAMRVAEFSQVQQGQDVLDYCAGLGTKATHLAEHMRDNGLVAASDISTERLRHAGDNARRLGISCIQFLGIDELASRFGAGSFDMVLVDAPCSNTGVLAKRPDARWRVKPHHLPELAQKQMTILQRAADFVRPGGSLVYSTCSIEPIENDELALQFSSSHKSFSFDADKEYLPYISHDPASWRDGGYMARWYRR